MSKKIIALMIAVVMILSAVVINTVSVSAAAPKVLKTFNGSDGGFHEGATKDEGTKTINAPEAYDAHIYNYNVNKEDGLVGGNIYKTAFYMTINAVDEAKIGNILKVNPGFGNNNIYGNQTLAEMWADTPFSVLKENVGQKVIVVGVFSTGTNTDNIQARLWKTDGVNVTIHKVEVAENGYDFGKDAEFKLISETTDVIRDFAAAAKVEYSTGMSAPDSVKDKSGLKASVYKLKEGANKDSLNASLSATAGPGAEYVLADTRGNFESFSKAKLYGTDGQFQLVEGFNNVTVIPNLEYTKGQTPLLEFNSIVLTGYIVPNETGEYKIVGVDMDNCAAMYIDGKLVYEFWQANVWEDVDDKTETSDVTINLEKDKYYEFEFYYVEVDGGECFNFAATVNNGEAKGFNSLVSYYTTNETGDVVTPDPGEEGKDNPYTSDVSSMLAIVTVAVAAIGGLKLKKRK